MSLYEINNDQKVVVLSALYNYSAETKRYLASYAPGGGLIHSPCCEEEAFRMERRNEEKVLLEKRYQDIQDAIEKFEHPLD